MAISCLKQWVNLFGRMAIFRLVELLLFIAQKSGSFELEYRKTHFTCLYWLKKKVKKRLNFCTKPWIKPFGKSSIFRLFELLVFIAQKSCYYDLEYPKTHFTGLYSLKKELEKWPCLDQNHGLTPLEKCQFFDFLNFLLLQRRKAFFRSRISEKTFSWPIFQNKMLEKWPFLDEKCQFFDFFNFLSLQPRKAFFRSRL